jgi:hypothetical protein
MCKKMPHAKYEYKKGGEAGREQEEQLINGLFYGLK